MATATDDRRWVIEQWQYLFGRMPTAAEVNFEVGRLQRGEFTRSSWMAGKEKREAAATVTRLYQQILGREPDAGGLAYWSSRLANGTMTRSALTQQLSGSTEGLLRQPAPTPDQGAENARDYLNSVLESYGLVGMGDWAWQQIESGYTNERILQNLRETETYKQRFVGMARRREAGLPAISEAQYIDYETNVRQMMSAAGLPPDFYDSPEDFATFIGNDVSPSEMQTRINEGYAAAAAAPAEVRGELQRLYGVGEGQLAAFFLDPDRALPLIQRQWSASQIAGAATRTDYGAINQDEAERLAALGVTDAQAQQGFSNLARSNELFNPMVGSDEDAIGRDTQMAAVFDEDATALGTIERRAGARKSAGSGAQSFALGQEGVSALGR